MKCIICVQGFRALYGCLKTRESPLLEIEDMLMGHSMAQFDSKHIFVNVNADEKRTRMILPAREIAVRMDECQRNDLGGALFQALPEGSNVYKKNMQDTWYPKRAPELEQFSLYNICAYFSVSMEEDVRNG